MGGTFLIGVTGGSSSGKTTVCQAILEQLGEMQSVGVERVAVLSADLFYRDDLKPGADLDHPC